MNKWDSVLKGYLKTGIVQRCPFCEANNIRVEVYHGRIRDSISFLCLKCKKSAHYDGLIRKQLPTDPPEE